MMYYECMVPHSLKPWIVAETRMPSASMERDAAVLCADLLESGCYVMCVQPLINRGVIPPLREESF